MANPNQVSNFQPQQGPYLPRVWGQGMGQYGMPPMPPHFGQQMPPQMMGMPPMPNQGQAAQTPMQNGPVNHPFLDEKGNFDFNKVMGHANNIHKFINTAKPMVQQLSPLFNMFKGY